MTKLEEFKAKIERQETILKNFLYILEKYKFQITSRGLANYQYDKMLKEMGLK